MTQEVEAPSPRAVVVPFGVPAEVRGIGLGLAALVHHFARTEGESVALAQLLTRGAPRSESHSSSAPSSSSSPSSRTPAAPTPAEAFISPAAWKELEGRGDAPRGVRLVLTGGFEPPEGASGVLEVVAFDPKTGRALGSGETTITVANAGKEVARVLDELCREAGATLDLGARIGDLEWEALESVLYAERAALYDPVRGEPHDRLAALIHLGRAVEESPEARYPAGRLAHLAMEAALVGDRRLAEAGHRALARASRDAPQNIDLLEATAALELRLGGTVEAEVAALTAITRAPKRSRLFALVSEARRVRGDLEGARAILDDGVARAGQDPILLTERGTLAAESGDFAEARGAWEAALAFEPIFPPAYLNLASLVMRMRDDTGGQRLVDRVLASPDAHPEVLRRALVLALAFEPEGIARGARVVRIGERLLSHAPNDAWTMLTTAHALSAQGDRDEARRRFRHVAQIAPESSLAAEASRGAFGNDHPEAAREIEAVVRASLSAPARDLPSIAVRSRSLALAHDIWMPYFALGMAERRSGQPLAAYRAFEETLARAPGCVEAHLEVASLAIELERPVDAVAHAERAFELAGEAREVLVLMTRALVAAGQYDDAKVVLARLRALDANDPELGPLTTLLETAVVPHRPGLGERIARHITERFRR